MTQGRDGLIFQRIAALGAGIALVLGLVAASPAPPAVGGSPVELTAILPLTGPGAQIGSSQQQGLQVLEKYVNANGGIRNRPVHFTYLDDQTNPQVSVQLFNNVVAQGAQVVIGGAFSAMCKATMPLVGPNGPVLYCLTPAVHPARGSYVFTSNIHPVDLSAATFRYFAQKGWNNIALLMSTDASAAEVVAGVDGLLQRYPKLHVVAYERFSPSDQSVAAQISKIEAAHPQAMLIWSGTGIPVTFHALSDAGNKMPIATSNSLMLYSAMEQFKDILPATLLFAAPKWAAYPDIGAGPVRDALATYFAAFKAAGIKPDMGQDVAWDPGLIIVSALRTLGPDAKASQIRDYIENLHGFAGANGYYDFRVGDQRGLNPNDVVMAQWDPQKQTWVKAK
jgi:branched-chain amino acid transport system substrate-binding protein